MRRRGGRPKRPDSCWLTAPPQVSGTGRATGPWRRRRYQGFAPIVDALIRAGAVVDSLDSQGRTPLMQAASQGKADCRQGASGGGGGLPVEIQSGPDRSGSGRLVRPHEGHRNTAPGRGRDRCCRRSGSDPAGSCRSGRERSDGQGPAGQRSRSGPDGPGGEVASHLRRPPWTRRSGPAAHRQRRPARRQQQRRLDGPGAGVEPGLRSHHRCPPGGGRGCEFGDPARPVLPGNGGLPGAHRVVAETAETRRSRRSCEARAGRPPWPSRRTRDFRRSSSCCWTGERSRTQKTIPAGLR